MRIIRLSSHLREYKIWPGLTTGDSLPETIREQSIIESIEDHENTQDLNRIIKMGRYELEYPKDATNLVKRHGERGTLCL